MIKKSISFFIVYLFCTAVFSQDIGSVFLKPNIINKRRTEINLNGVWLFQPTENFKISKEFKSKEWEKIQVPSSWDSNFLLDSTITKNDKSYNPDTITKAIYRTQVFVPLNWKNNASILYFQKISTDAKVFVNGKFAGDVSWYSGEVDLSRQIEYGKLNDIQILTIATATVGEVPKLMGTATSQLTFSKSQLASRGIIGDISILNRPSNTYISDVFVKPSVRHKNIEVDIELKGIQKSGITNIVAKFLNEKGLVEKIFNKSIPVIAKDSQVVTATFDFENPRIWDLDKPELYTLVISASQKSGINDEYNQVFGFREFWIDGKDFYLNGTKINLRPHLFIGGNGMDELIDASIDGIRNNGFNISEIWPNNFDERGFLEHSEQMMNRADKKGFLLMGVALPFFDYILNKSWSFQWDDPKVQNAFEKRMLINLKKDRNHPSVVMWTTTGNFFGDTQDQNPLFLGKRNWVKDNPNFTKYANAGLEAIGLIKKHDPTRPVFSHHGTYVGDVHTLNFYLGFLPLQEREEWLSEYAKSGQIPFMGIEFGTPLFCDFLRGRNGYGSNIKTEPLITEFAAMYLGKSAYNQEPQCYKSYISKNFIGGQEYQPMMASDIEPIWSFQQLQKIFIKNTWRSWRTYEISGGLLPWSNAHGWLQNPIADSTVMMKPFEVGRKGYYYPKARYADLYDKLAPAYNILPSGQTLIENNNQSLAYIAGPKDAFTEKNHNFKPNQIVNKQLILFNDTRSSQKVDWEYKIIVNQQEISKKVGTSFILPGYKAFEPIDFSTPNATSFKTNGKIIIKANIAGTIHHDTLKFNIFNHVITKRSEVFYVFDPEGITDRMLNVLGWKTKKWNGDLNIPFLVIGRNALSKGNKLPGSIEDYVNKGGRVLCFNQSEKYLEEHGFRVSKFLSRYIFPVSNNNLAKELIDEDLRNWSGVSTMSEAYPDYVNSDFVKTSESYPMYGWHWGNRGSVATYAVEKPHHGAWTPLFECEFDLAYSPLLELNYGKGKLVWCSLDIEDNFEIDPVASVLLDKIFDHSMQSKIVPRDNMIQFLGNISDAKILDDIGLNYIKSNSINKNANTIICQDLPKGLENEITSFVNNGGKLVILSQNKVNEVFGVKYKLNQNFAGSLHIDSNYLTRGLSVSDVKFRTNNPTIIIDNGCEIYLNGMLGHKKMGKGEIIYLQINPESLRADSLTYNRYTRWRLTRAFSQILTNLGSSFITDNYIFRPIPKNNTSITLDNTMWKAKVISKIPAITDLSLRIPDNGISDEAFKLMKPDANDEDFIKAKVPLTINDEIYKNFKENDGEVVFRKFITIPETMVGKDLDLKLAIIDDFDDTYFNGIKVGSTTNSTENSWNFNRTYTIPAKLIKEGENLLSIRVYDWFGGGGLLPGFHKREISLKVNDMPKIRSIYHKDYIDEFELGDNPFRYFRW